MTSCALFFEEFITSPACPWHHELFFWGGTQFSSRQRGCHDLWCHETSDINDTGVTKRRTLTTRVIKYFLYYTVLFVVYIRPDPISLYKISQINNFGFIPGKVFRDQARALYKMDENKLWYKGKMEEGNKEKAANIKKWMGAELRPVAKMLFQALEKLCFNWPDHDLIPGKKYISLWTWVSLRTTPSTLSVSLMGPLEVRWS